jgi:hypothetical protein
MRHAVLDARLLGFVFVVFGLNFFFGFLSMPPHPEAAGALIGALVSGGYLMLTVKIVEVVAGALLIAGRMVPLALVLLAPITANIPLFNVFLAPGGLAIGLFVTALHVSLMWAYRAYFLPLLTDRAAPQVTVSVAARPFSA